MRGIKLMLQEMHDLARQHKGKCLSKKYINLKTPLLWKCEKGHTWKGHPTNVKRGTWCPYCAKNVRLTIEEMQKIAEENNGKCLSKEYINHKTPLLWKCEKSHIWKGRPINVKNGTWCPYCAKNVRLTIEEMQKIAEENNGKCLSKEYKNDRTKLRWQCAMGHIFKATPNSVKNSKWCPKCAREDSRSNRPSVYTKNTIQLMQILAAEKGGKCLSNKYINVATKLTWQCKKGHIFKTTPSSAKKGTWCAACAGVKKSNIKETKKLATLKKGKCLSREYVNDKTTLVWKCRKGHEWKATPHSIKKGSWCPYCYFERIRKRKEYQTKRRGIKKR